MTGDKLSTALQTMQYKYGPLEVMYADYEYPEDRSKDITVRSVELIKYVNGDQKYILIR